MRELNEADQYVKEARNLLQSQNYQAASEQFREAANIYGAYANNLFSTGQTSESELEASDSRATRMGSISNKSESAPLLSKEGGAKNLDNCLDELIKLRAEAEKSANAQEKSKKFHQLAASLKEMASALFNPNSSDFFQKYTSFVQDEISQTKDFDKDRNILSRGNVFRDSVLEGNEAEFLLSVNNSAVNSNPSKTFYRHLVYTVARDLTFIDRLTDRYNDKIPSLRHVRNFLNGARNFTNKIWPFAFLGLLIHDFYAYNANKLDQYGVRWWEILLGTADSQAMLTTHLGSDVPTEFSYWFGASVLFALTVSNGFLELAFKWNKKDEDLPGPKNGFTSSNFLCGLTRFLTKAFCPFLFWSYGEDNRHFSKKLEPFFWTLSSFFLYAEARLFEIWINKIIGLSNYLEAAKQCNGQGMEYVFIEALQNFLCVICPWEFVSWWKQASSQACLDGLLSEPRDPKFILERMKTIVQHPTFKIVDGSRQNFEAWTETQFSEFLELIQNAGLSSLEKFSLASPYEKPTITQDHRVKALARFFRAVTTKEVDLTKAGFGDENIKVISPACNESEKIIYTGNKLTDEGAIVAVSNFNNRTTAAIFEENYISDKGMEIITSKMPVSVKEYNFGGNKYGNLGFQYLASAVKKNNVTQLVVRNNLNLARANYDQFFKTLVGSALTSFDASEVGMGDDQMEDISPYLILLKLKEFIANENPIENEGLLSLLRGAQNSTLIRVSFKEIKVDDEGFSIAGDIIKNTLIKEFIGSSMRSTRKGWQKFINGFVQNMPTLLDVSDNILGDEFILCSKEDVVKIENVILDNCDLTDEGSTTLINQTDSERIKRLSLSRNKRITDATLNSDYQGNSGLQEIILAGNKLGGAYGVVRLTNNPFFSKLNLFDGSANSGFLEVEMLAEARALIGNMPSTEVNSYNRDQIRWFQKNAQPRTEIRTLLFNDDNPSSKVKNIFSLISERLKLKYVAKNTTAALTAFGLFSGSNTDSPPISSSIAVREKNLILYGLDSKLATGMGILIFLMLSIFIYKLYKSLGQKNDPEMELPLSMNKGMNHA